MYSFRHLVWGCVRIPNPTKGEARGAKDDLWSLYSDLQGGQDCRSGKAQRESVAVISNK